MCRKLFSLISVVLLLTLALTGVGKADYVYTPMEQHLDANVKNIFDVLYLDIIKDATVGRDLDVTGTIITKGPWVDVRAYASFSAAIDAIASDEETLLIPDSQDVTDDKTVPS